MNAASIGFTLGLRLRGKLLMSRTSAESWVCQDSVNSAQQFSLQFVTNVTQVTQAAKAFTHVMRSRKLQNDFVMYNRAFRGSHVFQHGGKSNNFFKKVQTKAKVKDDN